MVIDLDLHMSGNEQGVEERKDTIANSSQVLNDFPGCLPEYKAFRAAAKHKTMIT